MLNSIKSKVDRVILLGQELNEFRKEKKEKYGNYVDPDNFREFYEDRTADVARKNIVSYLQSLTDDEVLAIQAIMYLGRDQDYNNNLY